MRQETISTGDTPNLVFEAQGPLKIEGWERGDVEASAPDNSDLRIEQNENGWYIFNNEEATVRVPKRANVKVERARRSLSVRTLDGDLLVERANGNLTLSEVHNVNARRVDGNFVAVKTHQIRCMAVGGNGNLREIEGDVQLGVGGNLDARQVSGEFSGNAGGNIDLTDVRGNISANAGGNAGLQLNQTDAQVGNIRVNVGGHLHVHLAEGTNASVMINDPRGHRQLKLGDGSGAIQLSAGGGVSVHSNGQPLHFEHSHHDRGPHGEHGEHGGHSDRSRSIALGSNKRVVINTGEGLRLTGSDGDQVIVEKYDGGLSLDESEGDVRVSSAGQASVSVPNGAVVRADVGIDATVRDFSGDLEIDCGADLKIRQFTGNLKAEAGADANVVFTPTGDECKIDAGADVRCRLVGPGNATVTIDDMNGRRERVFGDGSTLLYLSGGASVSVNLSSESDENASGGFNFSFAFDNDEFDMKMRELGEKMSNMTREFSDRFERSGVPTWLADEMSGMQERIDEAMRRAQDKINRKVDSAMRRAERRSSRRGPVDFSSHPAWNAPVPPEPPVPPTAPDAPPSPQPPRAPQSAGPSADERMMILRMLEQKKISAEQAAQLLAALGDPT